MQRMKEHNSHNYDMFLSLERVITEGYQRETDSEVRTERDDTSYFFLKTCFLSVSQKCPVNISQKAEEPRTATDTIKKPTLQLFKLGLFGSR